MYLLADMLEKGEGGPADPARARALNSQAAEAGNAYALVRLASMERAGIGGPRSLADARQAFVKAATELKEGWVAESAADMLINGEGGASDPKGAARLLQEFGEGDSGALMALAKLYRNGIGVAKNPNQARELTRRAAKLLGQEADSGNTQAQLTLAKLYLAGSSVGKAPLRLARCSSGRAPAETPGRWICSPTCWKKVREARSIPFVQEGSLPRPREWATPMRGFAWRGSILTGSADRN